MVEFTEVSTLKQYKFDNITQFQEEYNKDNINKNMQIHTIRVNNVYLFISCLLGHHATVSDLAALICY